MSEQNHALELDAQLGDFTEGPVTQGQSPSAAMLSSRDGTEVTVQDRFYGGNHCAFGGMPHGLQLLHDIGVLWRKGQSP